MVNLPPEQVSSFEQSLLNMQSALQEGRRIGYRKDETGHVEAYAYSKWKFWETWGSSQKTLRAEFENIAEGMLKTESYDPLIKRQIVKLLDHTTLDPDRVGKMNQIAQPLLNPAKETDRLSKEKIEIPKGTEALKQAIQTRKEAFDALVARYGKNPEKMSFRDLPIILEYRLFAHFLKNGSEEALEETKHIYEKLKQHVSNTREFDHFQALEYATNCKILLALLEKPETLNHVVPNVGTYITTASNYKESPYIQEIYRSIGSTFQRLTSSTHLGDSTTRENPHLLITADQLKIIKFFREANFDNDHHFENAENKIKEKLKEAATHLQKYEELFQKLAKMKKPGESAKFAEHEIKKALLDIELRFGRLLSISLLSEHPAIPPQYRIGIKNLLEMEKLYSPGEGTVNFTLSSKVKEQLKVQHYKTGTYPTEQYSIDKKLAKGGELVEKFKGFFNAQEKSLKPLTIFDAKPLLEYELYLSTFGDRSKEEVRKSLQDLHTIRQNLEAHYKDTHQRVGFYEIEVGMRRDFLFSLMDDETKFAELAQNNPSLQFLCEDILNHIYEKATQEPSVYGQPRELISLDDMRALRLMRTHFSKDPMMNRLLEGAISSLNHKLMECKGRLQQHQEVFKKLHALSEEKIRNLPNYLEKWDGYLKTLSPYEVQVLTEETNVQLILDAKRVMLDIELEEGGYFDPTVLPAVSDSFIDPVTRDGLQKAARLNELRSPTIDIAQLQSFKDSHSRFSNHPRVAIEGAGPTGLLLALTQYEAGSEVSLFEKRSGLYDRSQVVRLDTKWMAMLKFYLGEEYYKLFLDKNHKGVIREDGFGEITTMDLEAVLNIRLNELRSLLDPYEQSKLEIFAAHEVDTILPPAYKYPHTDGKFRLEAKYTFAEAGNVKQSGHTIHRDIDYFICAGGKGSKMRDEFLPSFTPVTHSEHYGVVSWYTKQQKGESVASPFDFTPFGKDNKDKFDAFQDFRGVVHINHDFFQKFSQRIIGEAAAITSSEEGLLAIKDQEGIIQCLKEFFHERSVEDVVDPEHPFHQTRTFENRGLIYIGMELPARLKERLNNLSHKLDHMLVIMNYQNEQNRRKIVESIIKEVNYAWFQTVADSYGYGNILTPQNMDKKFAARFDVEQNRVGDVYSEISFPNGQKLLVTAAGDSFSSPHFMRYSGLSGARKNITDLQAYARRVNQDPRQRAQALKRLDEEGRRTADFVIARGRSFLKPLTEAEILHLRREKMKRSLEDFMKRQSIPYYSEGFITYSVRLYESDESDVYRLVLNYDHYHLKITKDGKLQVFNGKVSKIYDSINQILLENSAA